MRYLLLSLSILFMFFSLSAQEMTGRLYIDEGKKVTLIPGDIFEVKLQIMNPSLPVQHFDFKTLLGQTFANHFYVVDVKAVGQNENNADVWQVDMKLVLKHYFDAHELIIANTGDINFPLSIQGISFENISEKNEKFVFAEQRYTSLLEHWLIICGAIAIVAAIVIPFAYFLNRLRKRKKESKLEQEKRAAWLKILSEANSREKWEELYRTREIWVGYLNEQGKATHFLALVESYQYQKEWTETQTDEVRSACPRGDL